MNLHFSVTVCGHAAVVKIGRWTIARLGSAWSIVRV